jgi:23S rRNA (guanine745-N1)-methyltransferase
LTAGSRLLCTVRECRQPLVVREESGKPGRLVCSRGHSFDVARSGYINLLQPQDRRSKQPGDSADAVNARRRLHDSGVTRPLIDAIADFAKPRRSDIVLDAGCGDGFDLGTMAGASAFQAHGLDLSIPAVNAAARRFPGCEWIVANADRFVPYADHSFTVILSITGRMNSTEFRRVLHEDGRLLVAIPSPEDLIELRSASGAPGRDRVPRTLETFAKEFTLLDQRRATTAADLDASEVQDVLLSVYRPIRPKPAEAMRLTFSLDLLLFHAQV